MCFSFGILKFGCSQQNNIELDSTITNNIVNNVYQSAVNNADASTLQVNDITISNSASGQILCPQGLNINQSINACVKIANSFTTDQKAQVINDITNAIKNDLVQGQENGLLAFLAQNGDQINDANLISSIQTAVSNSLDTATFNSTYSYDSGTNSLTIINDGIISGGSCDFVQNNLLNFTVTNITNTLQDSLASNTLLSQISTYVQQTQSNGNELKYLLLVIGGIVGLVIVIVIFVIFVRLLRR